jgi:hypothetical protein
MAFESRFGLEFVFEFKFEFDFEFKFDFKFNFPALKGGSYTFIQLSFLCRAESDVTFSI